MNIDPYQDLAARQQSFSDRIIEDFNNHYSGPPKKPARRRAPKPAKPRVDINAELLRAVTNGSLFRAIFLGRFRKIVPSFETDPSLFGEPYVELPFEHLDPASAAIWEKILSHPKLLMLFPSI
jgi:hypothetical protein